VPSTGLVLFDFGLCAWASASCECECGCGSGGVAFKFLRDSDEHRIDTL
jgi:hypothetical protein